MAKPSTREQLKDYCLRRLGYPVVQINVDDSQIEDRVDDALQFFAEYHFDGVERTYFKKQVTQTDIDRGYIVLTEPTLAAEQGDGSRAIEAAPAIDPDGNSIISVIRCFQLFDTLGGLGMFDAKYQIALNDLYGLRTNTYGDSLIGYNLTRSHMQMLQDMLTPEKSIQFSRVTNRIYVEANWKEKMTKGDYLLFEAYRILDPSLYPEIYNDRLLKMYLTALLKLQWGLNLSKFSGMSLPGGVSFNGANMASEAKAEVEKIEEQVQERYELPPQGFIG
jgi:hypothetical protein